MVNCAWCGGDANTLADGFPVYMADRFRDVWFQDWVDGEHSMTHPVDAAEVFFFCKPEHRNEYFFGL